jgi:DNA-binding NarL/FixJ family response regulator
MGVAGGRPASGSCAPVVLIGAAAGGNPLGEGERLRGGLASLGIPVTAVAGSAAELLRLAHLDPPDVALVSMAIRGNPLAAVADLCKLDPEISVVVLGPPDDVESLAALSAGAVGYLPPDLPMPTLARTLCAVHRGEAAVPRRLVRRFLEAYQHRHHLRLDFPRSADPIDLTEREWEVLQLVWQGRTTREIADRLFLSTSTVRTHVAAVAHKLGMQTREDLCALVDHRRGNVVQPSEVADRPRPRRERRDHDAASESREAAAAR